MDFEEAPSTESGDEVSVLSVESMHLEELVGVPAGSPAVPQVPQGAAIDPFSLIRLIGLKQPELKDYEILAVKKFEKDWMA